MATKKKPKKVDINFRNCNNHECMTIYHVSSMWNDKEFYYFSNTDMATYIVPLANILYLYIREDD